MGQNYYCVTLNLTTNEYCHLRNHFLERVVSPLGYEFITFKNNPTDIRSGLYKFLLSSTALIMKKNGLKKNLLPYGQVISIRKTKHV
jgi:hypothetical protein